MHRKTNACALSYVDPSFEMSDFSVYIRVTIKRAREQERVTRLSEEGLCGYTVKYMLYKIR